MDNQTRTTAHKKERKQLVSIVAKRQRRSQRQLWYQLVQNKQQLMTNKIKLMVMTAMTVMTVRC